MCIISTIALDVCIRLSSSGLYAANVVESPVVMGGLVLAGFLMLMLLVAIAYFVIKLVSSL